MCLVTIYLFSLSLSCSPSLIIFTKIKQIIAVFKINESLEISNIEGIGNLARQFSIACMDLKRNPYIMLASNTSKFDTEFAKFMDQIGRIEVCLHFIAEL